MHRTLIALAGIFMFVLLTAPAMAASDTVNATINVSTVWSIWDDCDNVITFTINNGEYDNGYVYPSGDPTRIKLYSNQDYNIKIEYDCPDGLPDGWHLWTIVSTVINGPEVPLNHSGAYEILDIGGGCYWTGGDQGPTNLDTWYFKYMLDGIELEDDWVGNHGLYIIYTLCNLP